MELANDLSMAGTGCLPDGDPLPNLPLNAGL
jgi:hypothetical protein